MFAATHIWQLEGVTLRNSSTGTQHILELNGRRYDALTGKPLPHAEAPASKARPALATGRSVDGFVKPKSHATRRVSDTKVAPHDATKSETLMRKAVKKPASITSLNGTGNKSKSAPASLLLSEQIAKSQYTPTQERLDRAKNTKRSGLIQRFGSEISALMPSKKQAAVQQVAHVAVDSVSMPIVEDEQTMAIDAAESHTQKKIKKTPLHHRVAHKMHIKPRSLSISAAVMAFVVLGGFFAYQNAPNLSIQVATRNSKVNGGLPTYRPAGFALDSHITYHPGEIILSYKSNSDNRNFQITQTVSSWDTESLRQIQVSKLANSRTIESKGKTIFLYDDSSATWVDAGVLYKIDGNSQLNDDQILHIANSL